jgi:hypothetical protein
MEPKNRFQSVPRTHFMKMEESVGMKTITMIALAAAICAAGQSAQAQVGAQASGSTSSGTSAQAGTSSAQVASGNSASTSAQAGQNSASLASGSSLNAELSQPVDAKKNKPGDTITARTTESTKSNGKVLIPRGTKLVGHVTEAKARTKGESESALGIVFDKAILKNGQEIPLNVSVQALAASQSAAVRLMGGDDVSTGGSMAGGAAGRTSSGSAGALGGVRSTAGGATGTVTNTAANVGSTAGGTASGAVNSTSSVAGTHGASGGLNSAGRLTSNSQGVFGVEGVNLNSATSAAGGAQSSVLTSTTRNVHLDSGTQLLLVSQSSAGAAASKP